VTAKHHIDNNRKLIFTSWEGKATDTEFIDAIKNYQEQVQSNPDYADYNEVLDFTGLDNFNVTVKGVRKVAKLAAKTDRDGAARKLAIVAPSNSKLFFVRMYVVFRSYTKKSNKDIHIFTNESDAMEWLK